MTGRDITLAVAPKSDSVNWITTRMSWGAFTDKLRVPIRGVETLETFLRMPKARQEELKNVGGFVGGELLGRRRRKDAVQCRDLVTLDMDSMAQGDDAGVLERLRGMGCAAVVYSTRKHRPERPRLRVILPTDRTMSRDEYEPIARMAAQRLGISFCDPTTFELNRMMYWPNCCADSQYVCEVLEGPLLNADTVLSKYGANEAWRDVKRWPVVPGFDAKVSGQKEKAGDPREKDGQIGAWCRVYGIREAIAEFIPEIYTPCDNDDSRFTYALGSTYGGALVYDDLFLYSHHGTDPCGGQLVNSWDMVRIHRFGHMDIDCDTTPINKRPSSRAMHELAGRDTRVKREQLAREIDDDFSVPVPPEDSGDVVDWKSEYLDTDQNGKVLDTLHNHVMILTYDPRLQDIRYNEMSGRIEITGEVPWTHTDSEGASWNERDVSGLRRYIEAVYRMYIPGRLDDAVRSVASDRHFDPVRDYLDALPQWDLVSRVDTLLIDYFGAEDNAYTRMAMRKTLCAAVARVYRPGTKFDCVLVLRGPQGIGKSTFFAKLAGKWFSDSLSLTDMRDKTGAEKLQGYWVVEMGELAGMRKMDAETVKGFISRTNDSYRAAYAPQVSDHPRRSIIVGTTNADTGFLRDATGNRRFWPIDCGIGVLDPLKGLEQREVDQIWAEAKFICEAGEKLYLEDEALALAVEAQEEAVEQDDRQGMVEAYLDRLLPEDWESMDRNHRRSWLSNDFGVNVGTVKRMNVCRQEIYCECFGMDGARMDRVDSNAIDLIMKSLKNWEYTGRQARCGPYGVQRVYRRKV